MKCALFYHSFISDWNHGNAHFIRGIAAELLERGHTVGLFEPENGWSYTNLIKNYGYTPVQDFQTIFPRLHSTRYSAAALDPDRALEGCDFVIVHEWNDPELILKIGNHRRRNTGYALLFHDTHHRCVSDPAFMEKLDLQNFDGILAFGDSLAALYREKGWGKKVWTWHEAADTRIFRPHPGKKRSGDVVWIGNWGDDERRREIVDYFIEPVRFLHLRASVFGVRYPDAALQFLSKTNIRYHGWVPNYRVPEVFSRYAFTVHIPRSHYVHLLPGIPTIRPFEALACGIPLISAPWDDREGLFTKGKDYLSVRTRREMMQAMRLLLHEPTAADMLSDHGLHTIRTRHTCGHRVDELLLILRELGIREESRES